MRKLYLTILILCLCSQLQAQLNLTITGAVKDTAGQYLANATVTLLPVESKGDTLRTATSPTGNFMFSNVHTRAFRIAVSSVGFAYYIQVFRYLDATDTIRIDDIIMSTKVKQLDEVTVTVNKTITIKEDTVEYKADSFKVRPEADVEALLKQMPGITVDNNGNITAHGKSVSKIKVNGKDFFNGDIKTATKELPANVVDAVQVIDDYGDQAAFTGVKDGDPDKIINLKIKKDKNRGYFGRGQAAYGTDDRYTVNGSINYFNNTKQVSLVGNINNTNTSTFSLPGGARGLSGMMRGGMPDVGTMNSMSTIMNNGDFGFVQNGQASNDGISSTQSAGINFRDDIGQKLSLYGSYTFSNRNTTTLTSTQQTNIFNTGNIVNNQNSVKDENAEAHRVYFNTEWKIDSFNQLKVSPSFSYNKSNSFTSNDFVYNRAANVKLNSGISTDGYNYSQPNVGATALYNHRFKKRGRLFSVNYSYGYNSTSQNDDRVNNTSVYAPTGDTIINNQHQLVTQDNINPSHNARVSYTEPIGAGKSIEVNYVYNTNFTTNDRQTNLLNGNTSTRLDSLSNIFDNTFSYQRYAVNYRFSGKKFNYTLGVAAQSNQMKGNSQINKSAFDKNSFNVFPVARFTYNFSRSRSLSFNYNAAVSAPSYSQLQPVYDYSNPQFPVVGNSDLKPEFRNTVSARYNNFDFFTGNVLFSNLSFTTTRNKVVTNSVRSASTRSGAIQETRYANADGYYTATAFINFSKPFKSRKYVLSANGSAAYSNDVSFINFEKNTGRLLSLSQGLNLDIRLKTWLEMGAGGAFAYTVNKYTLTPNANTEVNTVTLSSNGKIYFPKKLVLSYDVNKSFNSGYGVTANPLIMNAYVERQFGKNNSMSIRVQAFDIFNQNTNVSRTSSANSITDTRTNRLGRYVTLGFNVKLQKFKGQMPRMQFPQGPPADGGGGGMPPFLRP